MVYCFLEYEPLKKGDAAMPGVGFYVRCLLGGLIAGMLTAIEFKSIGSTGLVNVIAQSNSGVGHLGLVVGVIVATFLRFFATLLWSPKPSLRRQVVVLLGTAASSALVFIASFWFVLELVGVSLGVGFGGGVYIFTQVFFPVALATAIVMFLVKDEMQSRRG